jgi:hypothetical protein
MNEKELFQAAAQIAGGMAAAVYGKSLNVEDIAKKSVEIARAIEKLLGGPILTKTADDLSDEQLATIARAGMPNEST